MRSGDLEFLNYKNIIETIERLDTPSRAQVAKELGLSKTTLTNVVNVLMEKGYVEEVPKTEKEKNGRGRPGLGLSIKEDGHFALGASFDNLCWDFAVTGLNGRLIESFGPFHVIPLTPDNLINVLLDNIKPVIRKYRDKLLPAIGLGLPGIIDTDNNNILVANDLMWHSTIEVGRKVEEATGLKVFSVNRFTASGIAEYRYANPEGEKNMIYLGLGQGIRSAIFIDGKLLKGATYSAGRIAHITVDPRGPVCDCGKRGCLLTFANSYALRRNTLELLTKSEYSNSPLTSDSVADVTEICRAADQGDPCAMAAIDTIVPPLVSALDEICTIINPQKVILGGPIGYSSQYLRDKLHETINRDLPHEFPRQSLIIEKAKLERYGSALGAATLVLEEKAQLLFQL